VPRPRACNGPESYCAGGKTPTVWELNELVGVLRLRGKYATRNFHCAQDDTGHSLRPFGYLSLISPTL